MTTTKEEIALATQLREMKDSLQILAKENATLRFERDVARSRLRSLLPIASSEQEEEMRQQLARPDWIPFGDVVEELRRELS